MTILDVIRKLSGPSDELLRFLVAMGLKYPDLQPTATDLAGKLSSAVVEQNLVDLASALPGEIFKIAQGKLDGRRHPSDIG